MATVIFILGFPKNLRSNRCKHITKNMLTVLLLTPLIGVVGIILGCSNERQSKQVALLASLANFALSLVLWGEYDGNCGHFQFVQD
jgi:NADH:ubiquinone oxidoreductase subunit 4 (subunit M)